MNQNSSSNPQESSSAESNSDSPCQKEETENQAESGKCNRRQFMEKAATLGMAGGLCASYGTFAGMAGKFLYPSNSNPPQWMYVSTVENIQLGDSINFQSPLGAKIAITRQSQKGAVQDFIALSTTCPHLGCQVHWEGPQNRFFCPCHNGAFDAKGKPISGPPADANQELPQYPLKIENGLLYIQVSTES